MAGYRHTTMTQAIASVLTRLYDSPAVRWGAAEAQLHITDAMRTFAALTGLWQSSGDATLPAGTTLFDIPAAFPALRAYTIRDRDIVSRLQYHLWEPNNGGVAWSGAGFTDMFTLTAVVEAIQRRRDQFLLETGCRLTRHDRVPDSPDVTIEPGDDGLLQLDGSTIDVRRVVWVDAIGGRSSPVWATSFASASGAAPLWNVDRDRPRTYLYAERAPGLLELVPRPIVAGTLDLLTIDAGATLDPTTGAGMLIGIPDDFTPAIMWGAMADLLANDGAALDYARSLYCARRWSMLVAAASVALTTLYAEINGRPAQLSSLQGLDQARPNWQNESGESMLVALAGANIAAIYPPPRRSTSVRLTTVRNVPVVDADGYLQIGKELLDVILGYSVHTAMFKVGGEEFAATTHLADEFFGAALDHNERLRELAAFERARPADQSEVEDREQRRGVRRVTGGTLTSQPGRSPGTGKGNASNGPV